MSKTSQIALMSAQAFSASDTGSDVPDWVHLLPAGDGAGIETGDSRGPYHVTDPAQMIAASFAISDKLAIDENHSTDLAAPKGNPSPAKGWIVEMQARQDGIWGRVEWNDAGKELVSSHAYRGLSPVITHNDDKEIGAILRASLVNKPNLRGLTALNMESDMALEDFMAKLAKALGLKGGASEGDITSAIAALKKGGNKPELQSQMTAIGVALGIAEGGDSAAILAAAEAVDAEGGAKTIVALQAELATVTTKLTTVTETQGRTAAESFVDGAIKMGRVGIKPLRKKYIAMHMKDATQTEELIGAMPVLSGSGTSIVPPAPKDGDTIALNAEQAAVAEMLGQSAEDYAKTLKEETAL